MKTRDRSRCPECRERVLPFAAGCAICGADLDIARFDSGPSPLHRLGSWFGAISFGPSVGIPTLIAVIVVAYLAMRFL